MSKSLRVLIIEASDLGTTLFLEELRQGGYEPTYQRIDCATQLLAALNQQTWDIVIANYSTPTLPVSEALSLLKQRGLDLPVIVVSGSAGEDLSVAAMRAGASDYLMKGSLHRLVPAIERELKEAELRAIRQDATDSLRESEANLTALIENSQDAVWSVDTEHRIVTLNSVFKRHFYCAFGVELQKGVNIVECLPPDLQDFWKQHYGRALGGERFTAEVHYDIGENLVEYEISFNPIRTHEDKITGVAVFGRNITDRKQAEEELQQARDQLQAVLDAVPGCISWFSSDLKYLGINRYLAQTFHLRPDDFIGRPIGFLESSPSFSDLVRDFFDSSLKESSVEIASQVNGKQRYYLMVAQKYFQDQAAVFVGIDITDRKQVEEALRESQERYALAMRGANDGLWDWNLKTNEIYFSPRWKSMLGYSEPEIASQPDEWFLRVHPEDTERVRAQINLHLEDQTLHFESEYRILHKDGTYRWMLTRGLAVRDADGSVSRMAGSQTDITQRKQAEEQLLHDAFHDALTGLPNRALFIDRLGQAIERSKRSTHYLFAVLFLDLDRFKIVNDSLGHVIGDSLLVEMSKRLRACLRIGDTVARLGGDEFVILLEDIRDISDATRTAERIHKTLLSPFNLQGHEVFATSSIGIALSETGYERPEELLRDADTAMYRAKSLGRSRHEVFDSAMHARAVVLLQLETDLRRAIDRNEFQLYYQPIVCLQEGRIAGFEALIRWQHPERGLISPAEFIPVAEDTGLIIPIGAWVLREACRQTRVWQQQFPANPPLAISINLSGKQFSQPDLITQVSEILAETGLTPSSLKLEITETVVMGHAESAIAMLLQLKALGVNLQIDDFGTGYSSLSYLHRFPTDTLKIDKSFVGRMGMDDDSSEIVRAIVTLAHNLGMEVTAEGVETAEQLAQLKAIRSEYGQGYFFSKPVDQEVATTLLTAEMRWCELGLGTFG